VAAITWAAITVLGAAIGAALSAFEVLHLDGKLSMPLVIAGSGLALGFGVLLGACAATRLRFRPRIRSLAAAQERRERAAEADRAGIRVLEAYAEQVSLALTEDLGRTLDEEKMLLFEPAKLIERIIGTPVHISLWKPEADESGSRRWQPSLWPTHAPHECDDFRVPLRSSWIAYTQGQLDKAKVFGVPDIRDSVERGVARGADLTAFLRHDLGSLACYPIALGGGGDGGETSDSACLVMLARKANAFSRWEERYFVFIARLLALHLRIRALGPELEEGIAP
jgi:hypothetical protein